MNKKLEKIENIEKQIEALEKLCTPGAQAKIDKLNLRLNKAFECVSRDQKAIKEYEAIYGCTFEYNK